MPVLDVVVNPSGALSGARTVQRALDDIGRSATGMERTIGGAASRLKGVLVGLTAAFSLREVLRNTIEAEQSFKRLETALRSTRGVSGKTASGLAGLASELQNVTTYGDDAIMQMQALLLTFKDVRGTTFDAATKAILDLSAAMGQGLQSSAIQVGKALNDPVQGLTALRRAGIQFSDAQEATIKKLVETGDKAKAQTIILAELESQFGGMAQSMRGTLGGALEGVRNAFGDLLEMNKIKNAEGLRREIERLAKALQSREMRNFADAIGNALASAARIAAETLSKMAVSIEALKLAATALVSVKLAGWISGVAAAAGAATAPVTAAVAAMGLLAANLDKTARGIETLEERRGLGLNKSGLSAKIQEQREVLDILDKMEQYDALAVERQRGKGAASLPSASAAVEPLMESVLSAKGPSAVERLVSSIRDKMQYLYADGKSFLPVLDQWAAKLKPLSEDWKKIVDLQRDIRSDESTKAADDAIAAMKRLAEKERQQAEALEAARAGVQKFWAEMSWANQQGLMTNENYFDMLSRSFDGLKAKLAADSGGFLDLSQWENWTEEMKTTFASMQSVASQIASTQMTTLNEQLEKGVLTQKEWNAAVQELLDKYSALPAVVEQVNNAQKNTKKTSDEFGVSAKLWANDLSQGLAQAIVNAQDLGDALTNIAKQIASSALQKLLGGWIGGLFADGAAFQGGRVIPFAKGGIVTKPTIFPMARGMGLMGEAGPEAVMPLKRGSDGKLGVEGGGGTTYVTVNINAIEPQSFAQAMRSNKAVVESVVVENIMRNGAVRNAIRGAV